MENDYGGPLFIPNVEEDGRGFKIGKMAELLREPGIDSKYLANQLRYFGQQGLLIPYGQVGSGRTAHNLYAADQLLIAKILGRIVEFGTSDTMPLHYSAVVLQHWDRGEFGDKEPPPGSPAMWIIKGHLSGLDGFTFQLATFRSNKTGNRQMRARIQNAHTKEGTEFHIGDPKVWEQRSVFVLDLKPILARLFTGQQAVN